MTESKTWWRSATIWGALASMLAHLLSFLGYQLAESETQWVAENAPALAGMIADMIAIGGRVRARKRLGR